MGLFCFKDGNGQHLQHEKLAMVETDTFWMNLCKVGGDATNDFHETLGHQTTVISENEEILNKFTMR